MFHLTNSMFKSAVPNMNDILKKNPDLVKSMVDAVHNSAAAPSSDTIDASGRREMKGPGVDLSSLMGGIMMPPPPPINTSSKTAQLTVVDEDDDVSDIVSISGESTGGETRAIKVSAARGKRRGPAKNKKEISF